MIIETPQQSEIILKNLVDGNYWDKPIMQNYPGFDVCFLAFHPFYKIKAGHENKIKFERGSWPNKRQVLEHCDRLSWTEFMNISGISDYKVLDSALSFREWARPNGDRKYFDVLSQFLNLKHPEIIDPQTDNLSDILVNDILNFLKSKNYERVYIYDDSEAKNNIKPIETELTCDFGLTAHQRIETIDGKILIVTDFDCHHTYFFGNQETISELVSSIDLEGFYCDNLTTRNWSYEPIPQDRIVDREYTLDKKHYA